MTVDEWTGTLMAPEQSLNEKNEIRIVEALQSQLPFEKGNEEMISNAETLRRNQNYKKP